MVVPLGGSVCEPSAPPACNTELIIDNVELPSQTVAASGTSAIPSVRKPDPDPFKDNNLLGLPGVTCEIQNELPRTIVVDRSQGEVNPFLWRKAPRISPLE